MQISHSMFACFFAAENNLGEVNYLTYKIEGSDEMKPK